MAEVTGSGPGDKDLFLIASEGSLNLGRLDHVLGEIKKPENLNEAFFKEIKTNISTDKNKLQATFFPERQLDSLDRIEMTTAGDETHYGGKKAVFLKMIFKDDHSVDLVYKPRSLIPEECLEEALEAYGKKPRPMLTVENHGYDSRIIEHNASKEKLSDANFNTFIQNKINGGNKSVISLIEVLNLMEFEDTHNENFILDDQENLHFIDAEVFGTKANVVNMSDHSNGIAFYRKQEAKKNGNQYKDSRQSLKDKVCSIKDKLKEKVSTRLLLCSTDLYVDADRSFLLLGKDPKIKIGRWEINSQLVKFEMRHVVELGAFLHNQKFIEIKRNDSIEKIKEKMSEAFEGEDVSSLIYEELGALEAQKKHDGCGKEVPVFCFNFRENALEFSLSGKKLTLKKK